MSVSVLVPWRPTPDRSVLWSRLRPRWEAAGCEVVEGACPDGPWRKAVAVADAASRASGDVLVVADADVWCDDVALAVAVVRAGSAWAVPHFRVLRWNKAATAQWFVTGEMPARARVWFDEQPYPGRTGGGIVVLRRDVLEAVPMDPRFAGWGHEDEAWGVALRCLYGRAWRGTADLWHLWHQPQPWQIRGIGSDESAALYRRYVALASDQHGMREQLDEARRWPDG